MTGFDPRHAIFVSTSFTETSMCEHAFTNCIDTFPDGDWFSLVLRGYCALTQLLLCEIGL